MRRAMAELDCITLNSNMVAFYEALIQAEDGLSIVDVTEVRLAVLLIPLENTQRTFPVPLSQVCNLEANGGQHPPLAIASRIGDDVHSFLRAELEKVALNTDDEVSKTLLSTYFSSALVTDGVQTALNTIGTWRGVHFVVEVYTHGVLVGVFTPSSLKQTKVTVLHQP
jgi:hypothetical protein